VTRKLPLISGLPTKKTESPAHQILGQQVIPPSLGKRRTEFGSTQYFELSIRGRSGTNWVLQAVSYYSFSERRTSNGEVDVCASVLAVSIHITEFDAPELYVRSDTGGHLEPRIPYCPDRDLSTR
jgi:hypothetical protein